MNPENVAELLKQEYFREPEKTVQDLTERSDRQNRRKNCYFPF